MITISGSEGHAAATFVVLYLGAHPHPQTAAWLMAKQKMIAVRNINKGTVKWIKMTVIVNQQEQQQQLCTNWLRVSRSTKLCSPKSVVLISAINEDPPQLVPLPLFTSSSVRPRQTYYVFKTLFAFMEYANFCQWRKFNFHFLPPHNNATTCHSIPTPE